MESPARLRACAQKSLGTADCAHPCKNQSPGSGRSPREPTRSEGRGGVGVRGAEKDAGVEQMEERGIPHGHWDPRVGGGVGWRDSRAEGWRCAGSCGRWPQQHPGGLGPEAKREGNSLSSFLLPSHVRPGDASGRPAQRVSGRSSGPHSEPSYRSRSRPLGMRREAKRSSLRCPECERRREGRERLGLSGPSPAPAGRDGGCRAAQGGWEGQREPGASGGPGTCERRGFKEQRGPRECCVPQRPKDGEPESPKERMRDFSAKTASGVRGAEASCRERLKRSIKKYTNLHFA